MSYTHAIVWIDHAHAQIVHLDETAHEHHEIKNPHGKEHLHHRSGSVGAGRGHSCADFYDAVVAGLGKTAEIVVVGPAQAKHEFHKHVQSHHATMLTRIFGVEPMDHPSEGQLVAFARKYFRAADRMRPLEA